MTKNNTISENDIEKEIEKLKVGFLRNVDKIHKDAYDEIGKIVKKHDKKKIEKVKKDIKALKS
jgi:hypothetical protein